MIRKIKPQKEWPFFEAYHDSTYIIRHDCSQEIPLKERGEKSTYRLRNFSRKEIVVYKIDDGIICDKNVPKCDYGVYIEDNVLYLVELKGAELEHALKQIFSTIDILLIQPRIRVKCLNVRITLSKVSIPKIESKNEHKLKQLLHKTFGGGDYRKQSKELIDTI